MSWRVVAALWVGLLSLSPTGALAQTWSRTYDGVDGESPRALAETATGEILVAAWTDSFGTVSGDGWFLRLAADGTVLSENVAGDPDNGGVDGAVLASDGGVLFVGRNVVNIFTKHDAWAMRMDPAGNVAWGRLLAWVGFGRTFLYDAAEAVGGGWFVSGTSGMNDTPPQNAWLVKLDDMGNVLWQQEHGSGAADSPRSIVATADGGLIMVGTTTSGGDEDILLVKYDSLGGITWQRQLGGASTDQAGEVIALSGGGYAVAGMTQSFTASGRAPWLLRFDSLGTILWQVVYGDSEWGDLQALVETSDGDIVALGRISEAGIPTNDLWAVKAALADGTTIWERAYEGDSGDYGDAVLELADGGLLMAGTWGWGFPEESLWLLRTDSLGLLSNCDFVRDTMLPTSSPRVDTVAGPLALQPPSANNLPQVFEEAAGGATVTDRCAAAACAPLSCDSITVMPDPVCEGTDVALFAELTGGEGPIEVLWDVLPDPDIDAMGNPATIGLGPGTHQIAAIVTDSCADPMPQGCSMMVEVTVHPDMTPVITPNGPTSFCAASGESVLLDAGAGQASYQWLLDGVEEIGETGQAVTADVTGDWSVRVVDVNGCTWTSAEIAVDAEVCAGCPALSCDGIEIVPEPACEGEQQIFTAMGSGGEGTLSFEWDFDGDGLTDVVGSPAAWTYPAGSWPVSLTVTDACADPAPQSCVLQTMATVHPDQTPVIIPDGPTEFCASDGETLNLDAGAGYASYSWSLDGMPIAMSDQQIIPALASGSYTVAVVDANGCSWSSASVVVVADSCGCPTPLQCDDLIVTPATGCSGASQSFEVVFSRGLGPYQVAWDFDEDGSPDSSDNPVLWSLPVGMTVVSVNVVDTGCPPFPSPGCTLFQEVTVNPPIRITITADGPTSFCAGAGESVTLRTDDSGFASYQWARNGMDLPGEVADTLVADQSGTYTLSVTSASGCAGSSNPIIVDAGDCGCPPLSCDALLIEPGPPCDPRLYTLTVMATGLEPFNVRWEVTGAPDRFGNPVQVLLSPGMQTVEATVTSNCAPPDPSQQCRISETVDVPPDPLPGEVSDVRGGDLPLLVLDAGDRLVFEEEPSALGYNLHVGPLGIWYGPRAMGGECHRLDAVSGGDGSASLDATLPVNSWVVVTGSDDCFEGSAGTDSFGAVRDVAPSWEACGPLP